MNERHKRVQADQLSDHLVGPQQQRLWNRKLKELDCLEIDHEFELRGLLDW